jgi:hypothetical protein
MKRSNNLLYLILQNQHRRPQQGVLRAEEAQGHAPVGQKRTLPEGNEPPAIVGRHKGRSQQSRPGKIIVS